MIIKYTDFIDRILVNGLVAHGNMAHEAIAAKVAASHREYAIKLKIPEIFETLMTCLICEKPKSPLRWLSARAEVMAADKSRTHASPASAKCMSRAGLMRQSLVEQ